MEILRYGEDDISVISVMLGLYNSEHVNMQR